MNYNLFRDQDIITKNITLKAEDLGKVFPSQELLGQSSSAITGLNSIAGDLEVQEATLKVRLKERKELDAKLAELVELIRQARLEVGLPVEEFNPPNDSTEKD